jgi:hypothetical protein
MLGVCPCAFRNVCAMVLERYIETTSDDEHTLFRIGIDGLDSCLPYAEFRTDVQKAIKRSLVPREQAIMLRYVLGGENWKVLGKELGYKGRHFLYAARRAQYLAGKEFVRAGLYPFSNYIPPGYKATFIGHRTAKCAAAE